MIGGGVGIAGHIEICDDVVLAGRTSVPGSIRQPGAYANVWSAEPLRRWKRLVARLKLMAQRDSERAPRLAGEQHADTQATQDAQEADDE